VAGRGGSSHGKGICDSSHEKEIFGYCPGITCLRIPSRDLLAGVAALGDVVGKAFGNESGDSGDRRISGRTGRFVSGKTCLRIPSRDSGFTDLRDSGSKLAPLTHCRKTGGPINAGH